MIFIYSVSANSGTRARSGNAMGTRILFRIWPRVSHFKNRTTRENNLFQRFFPTAPFQNDSTART